ncbi:MAG: hypothetical protein AB1611_03885 [bacterium]
MIDISNEKLKELKEISRKRLPGFGPAIDIREAAETARKLSKIIGKHLKENPERET